MTLLNAFSPIDVMTHIAHLILLTLLPVHLALADDRTSEASPISKDAFTLIHQLNEAFVQVASEMSKSVVVIEVFEERDDSGPRFRRTAGRGSGMVITEDGYILTNSHVLEDAGDIRVKFKDGREFTGTIRGVDEQSDIAVVKIEASDLSPIRFADSSRTRVGEFAIAVGTPFNLDYSITVGHVSAKGRSGILNDPAADQDFIQTDASINPGNSGGPLVNIFGEVIGVNTLIRGIGTGISFAIPSNLAREVSEKIILEGKFVRSWLGVGIRSLNDYNIDNPLRQAYQSGVVITDILRDGPAASSELSVGDLVQFVDNVRVETVQNLKNQIRSKKIGKAVVLDVIRDSNPLRVEVYPQAWPEEMASQSEGIELTRIGITVEGFRIGGIGIGLLVMDLDQDSLGRKSGIRRGDIIVEMNEDNFTDLAEAIELFSESDIKTGVTVKIMRDGEFMEFEVKGETETPLEE